MRGSINLRVDAHDAQSRNTTSPAEHKVGLELMEPSSGTEGIESDSNTNVETRSTIRNCALIALAYLRLPQALATWSVTFSNQTEKDRRQHKCICNSVDTGTVVQHHSPDRLYHEATAIEHAHALVHMKSEGGQPASAAAYDAVLPSPAAYQHYYHHKGGSRWWWILVNTHVDEALSLPVHHHCHTLPGLLFPGLCTTLTDKACDTLGWALQISRPKSRGTTLPFLHYTIT